MTGEQTSGGDEAPKLPETPGAPPPSDQAARKPDGGAGNAAQGGEGGGADAGESLDDPGRGGD